MKNFSVNFSDRTFHFMNQQKPPNRSGYLEHLVLKDWAAIECGHGDARYDCPSCYARDELKIQKPRKEVLELSSLHLIRQQLCYAWITDQHLEKAQEFLNLQGLNSRRLESAEQQAIFLRAPFTHWGVYISALTLTLKGVPVFGAKDIRLQLQGLLGELWDTPGAKSGSVLPGDAAEGSKYADGYECLRIVVKSKRPTYHWVGFQLEAWGGQ